MIFVIDASAISHWLYHSIEDCPLADSISEWCESFIEKVKPEYAVACFDGKGNWRYEVSPEYKIDRRNKPVDEAKIKALASARAAFEKHFVSAHADGFEADDVVASIAAAFRDEQVTIVSSDKDYMQLVEDGFVRQYDPRPDKTGAHRLYDEKAVYEKMRVAPHRILDLLSIKGDSADSIPGVSGWGDKFAVAAINQTKSFSELKRKACLGELEHINKNRQIRIEKSQIIVPFSEQLEQLAISRKLASLRTDAPIEAELGYYKVRRSHETWTKEEKTFVQQTSHAAVEQRPA